MSAAPAIRRTAALLLCLLASAHATTILLPERPSPTEQFAARELQRYLGQITGTNGGRGITILNQPAGGTASARPRDVPSAIPPSRTEPADGIRSLPAMAKAWPENRFVIGRCASSTGLLSQLSHPVREIQDDSFLLAPGADGIHLLGGGDRGTLYAVYAFLERQGCRWYEPGPAGEFIPRRDALDLPSEPVLERPVFAVRDIGRGGGRTPEETLAVIDWGAKNRLNRMYSLRQHPAWRERGGQVVWQHVCHNTPWMLPNEKFFDAHPEYFSLYNGRRIRTGNEGGYLCTTHPEVRQIAADFIIRWFDQHPGASAIPISPPDGDVKWCECDACSALGGRNFDPGPDGHMTRRQVEFINAVAEQVAVKHPDKKIINLAYTRYVWPYPGMRMASNVVTQVAHGYAGNGSLVHSIHAPINAEARDIFRRWAEASPAGIGIWDYFILHVPDQAGSPRTPLGFGAVARDMMNFLAAFPNPYKVYFTQAGDELHRYNPFLYYAIARLAWDPAQPLEALRADYAARMFGPAGGELDRYLALLDRAYGETDWNPSIWRDITVPSPRVFTPAVLEQANTLLDGARAMLPHGDAAASSAFERVASSLAYVEATVRPKQLVGSADGIWRLARGEDAYEFNLGAGPDNRELLDAMRARAAAQGFLDESLERVLFRCAARREPIVWLENERLRVGVLPGVGGRILRLIDRATGQNLFHEPMDLTALDDPGAGYFRYGGYEEYTRKAFASPGWELALAPTLRTTPDGTELELEGVTPDGLRIRRLLRVPAGTEPELECRTELVNEGPSPYPAQIRIHPEVKIGERLDALRLLVRQADGQPFVSPVADVATMRDHEPAGWWAVVDATTGRGLLNTFAAETATTHLHLDRARNSLNLELFGPAATLATGESISFTHRYRLIDPTTELPDDVRAGLSGSEAATSQDDNVVFVHGSSGQGVRVRSTRTLSYPLPAEALAGDGAFAAWIQLDEEPARLPDAIVMSAGTRQPDYTVLAVRDGHLVFYRQQARTDGGKGHAAWCKVSATLPAWAPGTWHHVGVSWQLQPDRRGAVLLFADGEVLARRHDAELLPFREAARVSLGHDSANFRNPRLPGALDTARWYVQPLDTPDITALYDGREPAQPTHLLLDFEGTTEPPAR